MGKDGITEETVKIAVVEKRIDTFENTCHTARSEIKAELAVIKEELKSITKVNTKILLKLNTLETKHKTYAAIFGTVAGYIGAHLPGMFK